MLGRSRGSKQGAPFRSVTLAPTHPQHGTEQGAKTSATSENPRVQSMAWHFSDLPGGWGKDRFS